MINPKDVTIIIPHLGGSLEAEYALDQCLESLNETFEGRVLVVLNSGKCFKHAPGAIIIPEQGQCKAVNAAAATVNTPWIFVTNDDMIYAPGWFEELTSVLLENEKDLGRPIQPLCISPKLIEPRSGAPTFEVYFCGGAGGDFDKQKWLEFAENYEAVDTGLRDGFNLPFLISKELWDLVGGYDINYDPWGSNSDSDLEYKIKLAGVQPYQNTNCIVYHFSQTSGTFEPRNNEYYQRNFQVFKDKWGFDRTDEGIWEANFKIPTKEEGRLFNPDWEGKFGPV